MESDELRQAIAKGLKKPNIPAIPNPRMKPSSPSSFATTPPMNVNQIEDAVRIDHIFVLPTGCSDCQIALVLKWYTPEFRF